MAKEDRNNVIASTGSTWKCPLCGSSGPRNLEDALPSWVRKYAEKQPGGPYVGTAYGRPYSGKRPPAFRVPVCVSCNRWMGRTFEEPARPVLIPLFQGHPQTVLPDDQRIIARWMAKSALMQELFDGVKGRVPTAVYRTFRRTGEPPADCRVFIGRYADNGKLALRHQAWGAASQPCGSMSLPPSAQCSVEVVHDHGPVRHTALQRLPGLTRLGVTEYAAGAFPLPGRVFGEERTGR